MATILEKRTKKNAAAKMGGTDLCRADAGWLYWRAIIIRSNWKRFYKLNNEYLEASNSGDARMIILNKAMYRKGDETNKLQKP